MTNEVKTFIEQHIDLIEHEEFDRLYAQALHMVDVGQLTHVLYSVGIDPLKGQNHIPMSFYENGDIDNFIIPSHVDRIGAGAFFNCKNLTSIKIPDNVYVVGGSSFADCSNLKYVQLPNYLTILSADAFAETGVEDIVIPGTLTRVSPHCFEKCKNLETVKMGESVREIATGAFEDCSSLRYVQLNNKLETIGSYAFEHCDSLTEIYIPESVQSIDRNAFFECYPKIICTNHSYAHKYATQEGFSVQLV